MPSGFPISSARFFPPHFTPPGPFVSDRTFRLSCKRSFFLFFSSLFFFVNARSSTRNYSDLEIEFLMNKRGSDESLEISPDDELFSRSVTLILLYSSTVPLITFKVLQLTLILNTVADMFLFIMNLENNDEKVLFFIKTEMMAKI